MTSKTRSRRRTKLKVKVSKYLRRLDQSVSKVIHKDNDPLVNSNFSAIWCNMCEKFKVFSNCQQSRSRKDGFTFFYGISMYKFLFFFLWYILNYFIWEKRTYNFNIIFSIDRFWTSRWERKFFFNAHRQIYFSKRPAWIIGNARKKN